MEQPVAAPHFFYMYNPATGRWSYADPQGMVALGIATDAAGVAELSWPSLIISGDLPTYERALEGVLSKRQSHRLRYRVKTFSGAVVGVVDHIGMASPEDKWPMVIGCVVRDEGHSTVIQKAERQALMGRLAGGMIHDFRNLLSGVQNIVEWCGTRSCNDATVREALMNSVRYIERGNAIINGLLKLMGGKGREAEADEPVDLGGVIHDLEPLIRHLMPPSVSIEIAIASGTPAVFGRRGNIQDMILNLCTNAKDAMPDAGTLSISVSTCGNGDGKCVVLGIEDSGHGMPPEMLESIFDAFYSTKEFGAGLGLWMVREAVNSCNARIEVKSEVGRGTSFEIVFPALAACAASPSAGGKAAQAEERGKERKMRHRLERKGTVLLIEDEPLIRDGVAGWLESMGLDVVCVGDGQAGWRLFEESEERFDIVVQDYVLPGGESGEELLKRFVTKRPGVPVIVTSGHPDVGLQVVLREAGAFAFLPKPFKLEELGDLIHKAFQK